VNNANAFCDEGAAGARRSRGVSSVVRICALASALVLASFAQAQTAQPSSPPKAEDTSLTYHGITLYGIVDVGLQYDTHAAPFSDYFMAGSADIVQKNSRRAIIGLTPNNLSQSRIGLQGTQPLGVGDWSGVFKVETFFNPTSGNISDALKSLTQNNGRSLANQTTNIDSSIAGQLFQQSFAGLSSAKYGTITFGRQNTVLADGISKYDPNAASQAFSLIGLSGTAAGGGDTQDRRLDSSVKYVVSFAPARLGAIYKFSNGANRTNSAYELSLGADYAGASADVYYAKVNSAISVSGLSAAQVATLPTLGLAPDKSLAGTISDNTTYMISAMYTWAPFKLYASWEHIKYSNPANPLPVGTDDIGGYVLAVVNNAAFPSDKGLEVYWAGVKWSESPKLDFTFAYYGYHQNSYAVGALKNCSTNVSGQCSGSLRDVSIDAVYKFSKRFDAFAGIMYSGVSDGLANGYIYSRNNFNPTIGVRFTF